MAQQSSSRAPLLPYPTDDASFTDLLNTLSTLQLSEIEKIPEAPRIQPAPSPFDLADDDFQLQIKESWKRKRILVGKGRRIKNSLWKSDGKANRHRPIKK